MEEEQRWRRNEEEKRGVERQNFPDQKKKRGGGAGKIPVSVVGAVRGGVLSGEREVWFVSCIDSVVFVCRELRVWFIQFAKPICDELNIWIAGTPVEVAAYYQSYHNNHNHNHNHITSIAKVKRWVWLWDKWLRTWTPFLARKSTCCTKLNLGLLVSNCNSHPILSYSSYLLSFHPYAMLFSNFLFAVSVIGIIIMATLFLHELGYYLSTYTVHQVCTFFFLSLLQVMN